MQTSNLDDSVAESFVSVRNVWMTYLGKRKDQVTHVLQHINLDVRRSEFVCIVGSSGCGKSTLLNIAAGFVKATQGQVTIAGVPVKGPDSRRLFIFQENAVFPWLTVAQNVGLGLLKKSRVERDAMVQHCIDMVGLTDFKHAFPRELSGGMRQRAEIARALAAKPEVIFMDEPFGALDFITRLKMRSDLVNIWQEQRQTILFVTHDIEEAVQLADRVIVMSKRPSTIQEVFDIDLPRPRDLDSSGYLRIRDAIFESLGMSLKVGN